MHEPDNNAEIIKRRADPRWQRTREKFVRAGFELFGEFGAEGVSVDAIVDRAGVSKQTFYNHFLDREAFVHDLWIEARGIVEKAVTAANADIADPVCRLVRGVVVYARLTVDDQLHGQFVARAPFRGVAVAPGVNIGLQRDLIESRLTGRLTFESVDSAQIFVAGTALALVEHMLGLEDEADRIALSYDMILLMLNAFRCDADEAKRIARNTVDAAMASQDN